MGHFCVEINRLEALAGEHAPLVLRIGTVADLVQKASAELEGAEELVGSAREALLASEAQLCAVLADRAAFGSLVAFGKWLGAQHALPEPMYSRTVDAATFFFIDVEHVPLWDGRKMGFCLVGTHRLSLLLKAMRTPDYSVFQDEVSAPSGAITEQPGVADGVQGHHHLAA